MRKLFVNILATTAMSLLCLAAFAGLSKASFLQISTVFQVFGVNLLIHLFLKLARFWEFSIPYLSFLLDLFLVTLILVLSAHWLDWYRSTPSPILVGIGIITYAAALLLDIFYLQREAMELNRLIKKRKKVN